MTKTWGEFDNLGWMVKKHYFEICLENCCIIYRKLPFKRERERESCYVNEGKRVSKEREEKNGNRDKQWGHSQRQREWSIETNKKGVHENSEG